MTPAIRRLGPGDRVALRGLNALFADAFDEPDTYLGTPPDAAWVDRCLGAPSTILLVACDGDAVIGGLVAYVLDKIEQSRSEVYIYDLAVAAPFRRQGVATALIAALRPIARAAGAWVIYVQADPPDAPAVALYDGLGTREAVLHFDLPVGEA